MKKGFNGLITRLNTSRKTDDFKDRSVEISQTEMQRKKKRERIKKNRKQYARTVGHLRRRLINVMEGGEREEGTDLFEVIMAVKFSKLMREAKLQIQEVQFSAVQLLSQVRLFVTPWTAACQASLSITKSWSLLKLMSIMSVVPSNQLILCRPLILPPSTFPSIRVFSSESVLRIR